METVVASHSFFFFVSIYAKLSCYLGTHNQSNFFINLCWPTFPSFTYSHNISFFLQSHSPETISNIIFLTWKENGFEINIELGLNPGSIIFLVVWFGAGNITSPVRFLLSKLGISWNNAYKLSNTILST